MGLRTTAESELERCQIDQEWERERAYPLANLSTARRTGLRFVKATKTDEEWQREASTSQGARSLTSSVSSGSASAAREHAEFYKSLTRSGTSTPGDSEGRRVSAVASTSRVLIEQHQEDAQELHEAVTAALVGQGSKDEPFLLLDEDDEAKADKASQDGLIEGSYHLEDDSHATAAMVTTSRQCEDAISRPTSPLPTSTAGTPREGSTSTPQSEQRRTASSDEDASAPQGEGDMYCLLCETIVPGADVARHPTSVLHNLSKSQSKSGSTSKAIQPLIPPTYYALKANNVGHSMLRKLGWTEEEALGRAGTGLASGRKQPIKASDKFDRKGLGVESKRRFEEVEREGKIVKVPRNEKEGRKVARPLAKNKREMERDRRKDMAFFKAGLAYLNS